MWFWFRRNTSVKQVPHSWGTNCYSELLKLLFQAPQEQKWQKRCLIFAGKLSPFFFLTAPNRWVNSAKSNFKRQIGKIGTFTFRAHTLISSCDRVYGRDSPRIRLRGPWCKGCCRRTSPHHWRPGSAAPCRSCRWRRRTTPQTGGSCRWSFAWPRLSVVWGRSSVPCLLSFLLRQHRKAVGGRDRERDSSV